MKRAFVAETLEHFLPDDPQADDLKRKDFIVGSRLADRQITSRTFLEFVIDRYRTAMPLMQFLAESVGR